MSDRPIGKPRAVPAAVARPAPPPPADPVPTAAGTPATPVPEQPAPRIVALPPVTEPPADPRREQDVLHLQAHLADLKTIIMAFPHTLDGRLGEVVAYLKERL